MAISNLFILDEGNDTSSVIEVDADYFFNLTARGEITDHNYTWLCHIEKRMTDMNWVKIDEMTPSKNCITIYGEGFYRVSRIQGKVAVDLATKD